MKRREFLKGLAAVPLVGAVVKSTVISENPDMTEEAVEELFVRPTGPLQRYVLEAGPDAFHEGKVAAFMDAHDDYWATMREKLKDDT